MRRQTTIQPRSGSKDRHDSAMAVLRDFRVIYGSVRQHFREVERLCGVSGSQLWILEEVHRSGGIGVSDLARKLAIHQSTCSQLVDKLVRGRRVAKTRSSDDQRRVDLTITEKGKQTMARAPGPPEGVLPEALGELSIVSLRSLHRSLQQVIRKLDLEADGADSRPLSDL